MLLWVVQDSTHGLAVEGGLPSEGRGLGVQLFQQSVSRGEKPLKRLGDDGPAHHRAKATVLMRAFTGVRNAPAGAALRSAFPPLFWLDVAAREHRLGPTQQGQVGLWQRLR